MNTNSLSTRELVLKNMICTRCIKVIRQELEQLGVEVLYLQLGKLRIRYASQKVSFDKIRNILEKDGFELAKNKEEILVESIKRILIKTVNSVPFTIDKNLSDFLGKTLNKDYWTLSKTFSKFEGTTIEKYFIMLKIEKAKELIGYGEMNFSEIAFGLGYANLNHLSNQFKKLTNMSMSDYKKVEFKRRLPLDKIL
ncbi:AraC family transcriptional regulator [Lewinella cohaerens]|uniref:AraC family transcriptional regulator n=1 Tax=Lewinella cohaerens TaxID=70995 RepID=UPI00036E4192|nr:AraC family transcriptional regulator [Lewinella cohaerens]